jgi:ABC-type glutathione transport system ATPase component
MLAVDALRVTGPAGALAGPVDLRIEAGERVGLIGASGSGKSLTARALLGLLPTGLCAHGDIRWNGGRLVDDGDFGRLRGREIGYVFQDAASNLHPLRRLSAQFDECLRVHRPGLGYRQRRAAATAAMASLRLDANLLDRYPHELSGGQRQRALLALTLLPAPTLLIADEPTSALDAELAQETLLLLSRECVERGMALLLISHDLAAVERVSDRIVALPGDVAPALPQRSAVAAVGSEALCASRLSVAHRRRWRAQAALADIDFSIARGERIAIGGGSGSGKSTLAQALLGLKPVLSGDVRWFGTSIAAMSARELRAQRPRVQMVFQDPYRSLDPTQRVDAMLREAQAKAPRASRDIAGWLSAVGLDPHMAQRYPSQFSGGQRQRLALARALATEPEVLICDEATSALDSANEARIVALIDSLAQERELSLLLISHSEAVSRALCDRLLWMREGRLVA